MNYFDDELNILEWFQTSPEQYVYFPVQSETTTTLFNSLIDKENFSQWVYSAGKSDPPPDFYNKEIEMMMDIMRIDDHGHLDENGKYTNPVNQRESKLRKNLNKFRFFSNFTDIKKIFINAVTDLPEFEDHNYKYYFDNFKRTIEKHIKSIPLYKSNHPGYKVVFFIFDESSGYVLAENERQAKSKIHQGECFYCSLYSHFADKRFAEVFLNSDIDYLVWYSPFKHFESNMPEMPNICVFDIKKLSLQNFYDFQENLIMSTEE